MDEQPKSSNKLRKIILNLYLFSKQTITLYALLRLSSFILKIDKLTPKTLKSNKLTQICALGFLSGYLSQKYCNFFRLNGMVLLLSRCLLQLYNNYTPSNYQLNQLNLSTLLLLYFTYLMTYKTKHMSKEILAFGHIAVPHSYDIQKNAKKVFDVKNEQLIQNACIILHPENKSCVNYCVYNSLIMYKNYLLMYLKLYFITTLLFKGKTFINLNTKSIFKLIENIVKDAFYTGSSCTSCFCFFLFMAPCLMNNIFGINKITLRQHKLFTFLMLSVSARFAVKILGLKKAIIFTPWYLAEIIKLKINACFDIDTTQKQYLRIEKNDLSLLFGVVVAMLIFVTFANKNKKLGIQDKVIHAMLAV